MSTIQSGYRNPCYAENFDAVFRGAKRTKCVEPDPLGAPPYHISLVFTPPDWWQINARNASAAKEGRGDRYRELIRDFLEEAQGMLEDAADGQNLMVEILDERKHLDEIFKAY